MAFSRSRKRLGHLGFTVIEVLLVLAVIVLAAGLFIVNVDTTIGNIGKSNAKETLQEAIAAGRLSAISQKTRVSLLWDEDASSFNLYDVFGREIARYPIESEQLQYIEDFRLWPVEAMPYRASGASLDSIELRNEAVDMLEFDVDGTSSFVAIECIYDPAYRDSEFWLLDPFSNGFIETDRL